MDPIDRISKEEYKSSSRYASAKSELDSNESFGTQWMSLGPTRAALLRDRLKPASSGVRLTQMPDTMNTNIGTKPTTNVLQGRDKDKGEVSRSSEKNGRLILKSNMSKMLKWNQLNRTAIDRANMTKTVGDSMIQDDLRWRPQELHLLEVSVRRG